MSDPFRTVKAAPARATLAVITAAAMTASASLPARAQAPNIPTIRDAETEQLMRDYTAPILKAAGLTQQNIRVALINDRTFNAFVIDGRRIFVNAGAIMDSRTPNELIGVLAHETGHIAGGHLSRLREQLAQAQTLSIVAMLLGLGAAVAGARAGANSGAGNIGMAAITAPQEAIRRTLLSYQRNQEEQADRAAVKFLSATGQSPKGLYDSFKRLGDNILYAARGADPYQMSHPMPAERVAALEIFAKQSPYWDKKDPPELQMRHDLVRAKLYGFIDRGDSVARRYPFNDTSLPARYARAIATYRHGDLRNAITQIDGLIQTMPNNAYFHELKGQALLEGGKPQEAIAPLRRAVQLAPQPALIQIMLAQALIAANNPSYAEEAASLLRVALGREPEVPEAYSQLAMAYGKKGDLAQADLASAQAAYYRGDGRTARQLASRAKTRLPVGSPAWVRADDLANIRSIGESQN